MKRIVSISLLMFCLPFFLFAQSASSGNGGQRANGYEYVDLGLSVKWATCNVGASSPEEFGGYYQWAGTRDVTSTNIKLDWDNCPYHTGANSKTGWTKYTPLNFSSYWSGNGNPDNRSMLEPSDDVVQVKLGGKWRIPTKYEWKELYDNCTWTWTTQNEVKGYKVTSKKSGYTNKSIFLPAAGSIDSDDLASLLGFESSGYWSSSLDTERPDRAYHLFFESIPTFPTRSYKPDAASACYRYIDCSVRPVYGDPINVTGVSLDKTRINLNVGATYTLKATVTPSNAPDQTVSWSSSNTNVATVNQSGKVIVLEAGYATITVRTSDGDYAATCSITVTESTPEAVDLGLSVKWATCNIGASKSEEYGKYYAWGDVTGLAQKSSVVPMFSGKGGFPRNPNYKLNNDLSSEYDAAHVKFGGKWRMPTKSEFEELINNCKVVWTTVNGVNGRLFTSEKPGYEGKSIFLPAAGIGVGSLLSSDGSDGYYWSSTVYDDNRAYSLDIDSDDVDTHFSSRFFGCSIRPVLDY